MPTLPEAERKGDRGPGYLQAARVVSELSIRQTLTAIRLRQHAVPTLPRDSSNPPLAAILGVDVEDVDDVVVAKDFRAQG